MSRQWFPLYVNDYMGDTMRFTTEEHGAYILILIDYWSQQKAPPDDDEVLREIAKVSRHKWSKISQKIREKFCIENGAWKHRRIEEEIEKANRYSKIQSDRRKGKTAENENRRLSDGCSTDKPPTPTNTDITNNSDTSTPVSTTSPLPEKTIPTHRLPAAPKSATGENVVNLRGKPPDKPPKEYAWRGETFRLTIPDWRKWKRQYWSIADLAAMLDRIDEYYAENPDPKRKPFFAFSGWLNSEHQKQVQKGAKMPEWLRQERANAG